MRAACSIDPDYLNTPRLIANSTGTTVWRWDQGEPFGNDVPNDNPSNTGNHFDFPLRFPGQYFDRENNLAYNYFRDYDSGVGRYIESDPIGLHGGISTYADVGGHPINRADRRGLDKPGMGPYDPPWSTPDTNPQGGLPSFLNPTGEPGFPKNQETSCVVNRTIGGAVIGGAIGFIGSGGKPIPTVVGACLGALVGATYGDLTCPSDDNK